MAPMGTYRPQGGILLIWQVPKVYALLPRARPMRGNRVGKSRKNPDNLKENSQALQTPPLEMNSSRVLN